jgi:hypothetical protein
MVAPLKEDFMKKILALAAALCFGIATLSYADTAPTTPPVHTAKKVHKIHHHHVKKTVKPAAAAPATK